MASAADSFAHTRSLASSHPVRESTAGRQLPCCPFEESLPALCLPLSNWLLPVAWEQSGTLPNDPRHAGSSPRETDCSADLCADRLRRVQLGSCGNKPPSPPLGPWSCGHARA